MIAIDLNFANERTATVSIRRFAETTYAYEVCGHSPRPRRGTVTHQGAEDFALIEAVVRDYVRCHGG